VRDPLNMSVALAHAFLAGDWDEQALIERGAHVLGRRRSVVGVVHDVLQLYHRAPLDRPRELAQIVDASVRRRRLRIREPRHWFIYEAEMGRMRWPVPPIASVAELAAFLDVDYGRLRWLADTRGLERSVMSEQLRNYRYAWFRRPGSSVRAIERPKQDLKAVQRRILREILDLVPAHDAAHGFRKGRSVVTHARAHVGRRAVMRFDLESFFTSVEGGRIYGIFRTMGYPESVAYVLTGLCVNIVPRHEWAAVPRPDDAAALSAHARLGRLLASPHLPQGAPTSPALASLAALGLDRRVAALAARFGATYTRYADDLALSGDARLLAAAPTIRTAVAEIARDEGFRINVRKSQLMTSAGRQRICGVVVNVHPNVARAEYDSLKAILHNAARGRAQVDRAHLLGRVAWVESVNPARGARLRERFARIEWPAA
jgi:RNA-directed DNA polymerase